MSKRSNMSDKRIPSPSACVTGAVLDRQALERPDQVFALFEDGETWTYRHLREVVRRTAAGLQQLDVRQGDPVLCWLPNGRDFVRLSLATNYLGAIHVPLNLGYRGGILEHVIRTSGATLIVVSADRLPRLLEIDLCGISRIIVVDGESSQHRGVSILGGGALATSQCEFQPPGKPIQPWDTQTIIFTSGTTGRSKGVLCSYLHIYSTGEPYSWLSSEDRYLINLPLFHVAAAGMLNHMLTIGGSVAIVGSFSTKGFWSLVRETRSTCVTLLGAMARLLVNQPATSDERQHGLTTAVIAPLTVNAAEFASRFSCTVRSGFNMTETSGPLMTEPNPQKIGSCGKPRPGIEARLVDENDCEVATGCVGELVLRADRPWSMNHGYFHDPEATMKAWRNGWFHTGDLFRLDAEGDYIYVDRLKDSIRRRGENISSVEVETEIGAHPAIKEVAVVGVTTELGDEEVLAAVSLVSGASMDPADLIRLLTTRMAHFMVPRYVRILDQLPHTPTQKILKTEIRAQGIAPGTFDRDAMASNPAASRGGSSRPEACQAGGENR